MTKEEIVQMLKNDIKKWNDYIRQHPEEKIDLSGVNLEGEDLRTVVLRHADLRGANLIKANLMASDLEGADLRGADLGFASISASNLSFADFTGADVSFVNFRRCNMTGTKGLIPVNPWEYKIDPDTKTVRIVRDKPE